MSREARRILVRAPNWIGDLVLSLGGEHVVELSVTEGDHRLEPRELAGLPSVRAVHAEGERLSATVGEPHVAIPALLEAVRSRGLELASLTTRHASLEDVFVSLTGRRLRDE